MMVRKLSYSQIQMFEKCSQLWYWRYVKKIKVPYVDSAALQFGRAVDQMIEDIFKGRPLNIDPSRFRLSDNPEVAANTANRLSHKAVELINQYLEDNGLGGYMVFQKNLNFRDFQGRPDMIVSSDIALILDHKTTKYPYTDHQVKTSEQLTCYAWLYYRDTGHIPRLGYTEINKKDGHVKLRITERTERHLKDWEKKVEHIRARMAMEAIKEPGSCINWWDGTGCAYYHRCWHEFEQNPHIVIEEEVNWL